MTDIKPQWRYLAMTEQFGPCGVGWKFTIEKLWTEEGSENQIVAFASINLFIAADGKWSDPIPGIGGSMLVTKEKNGPHTSDEAYKMAVTDGLSTAMKLLGVAADVYMGNWDGSRFKEETKHDVVSNKHITTDQAIVINDLLAETKKDVSNFLKYFGFESVDAIPASKYDSVVLALNERKRKIEEKSKT